MRHFGLFLFLAASLTAPVACVGDAVSKLDPRSEDDSRGDAAVSSSADGGSLSTTDGSPVMEESRPDAGERDAAPDAPTPPFDVASLRGLRLWLDSSRNLRGEPGSTAFASWGDSSRAGSTHLAVPHDVNPPSLVPNGFGGKPTVSFTAGNGYIRLPRSDDFQLGTGDFLLVSVAKVSSGSGPLWRLKPNATAGSEQEFLPSQFCHAYGIGVTNACTSPAYSPNTEPHVFAVRRKSSLFAFRVDGVTRGSLDVGANPADITIGEFAQPYVFIGNGVTMQVSEMIVIVGPTSDSNVGALEAALKTKYSLP